MADVFISYSSDSRETTRGLARDLELAGLSVWWDKELVAGAQYHAAIDAQLEQARVVVVIWTPSAVKSEWVLAEAERGRSRNKLVTLRVSELPATEIPTAFLMRHAIEVSDRPAIYRALATHGLTVPPEAERTMDAGPVPPVTRAVVDKIALQAFAIPKLAANVQFQGHSKSIKKFEADPSGRRLLTISEDATCRLWDLKTGGRLASIPHNESFGSLATFSFDGTRVITHDGTKHPSMWDAQTGDRICELKRPSAEQGQPKSSIVSRLFSQKRPVEPTEPWQGVTPHVDPFSARVVLVDRQEKGNALLLDTDTGGVISTLDWLGRSSGRVAFAAQTGVAAIDDANSSICVFETATGHLKWRTGPAGPTLDKLTIDPQGRRLVASTLGRDALLWDLASQQQIAVLRGHERNIEQIRFSGDGRQIVTTAREKRAFLWSAGTGELRAILNLGAGHGPEHLTFREADGGLVTWLLGDCVRLWDQGGAPTATLGAWGRDSAPAIVGVSPNGARIVTVRYRGIRDDSSEPNLIQLWDGKSAAEVWRLECPGVSKADDSRPRAIQSAVVANDAFVVIALDRMLAFKCSDGQPIGELNLRAKTGRFEYGSSTVLANLGNAIALWRLPAM